ncbi:zinc/manganese transport system substrate-binding protein [Rhodococcus sp. SORGH_AS 301]|nr:zinc/manganese transport system substrate-binding protein [Rhodococcus sp. SORGH_AS_0301]
MYAPARIPLRTLVTALGMTALTATALVGCSSDDTATAESGRPTVVASTNVWGSVAEAVVGDRADVTAIISDPSADPHSYEASPGDAAALSEASLVVYNGGGYDEFVDDVLGSAGDVPSVDAYSLLEGHADDADHADEAGAHDHSGETNEHVWYDPEIAAATAEAIATELGKVDPDNAAYYTENAEAFHDDIHEITDITDRIAQQKPGAPVAQTEPIAHYLLEGAGVDDKTPEDFEDAIEEGNDPSPAAVAATRDLFTGKGVDVLVYNIQTEDAVTEDVRRIAEENGIRVVEVTETLPAGQDYVSWQRTAAQDLADALGVV